MTRSLKNLGLSSRLGLVAAGAALTLGLWGLGVDGPSVLAPAIWHADRPGQVTAYVDAAALAGLQAGMTAHFYPAEGGPASAPMQLVGIDSTAFRSLPDPELASPYGGPLAAGWDSAGALRLNKALYRVYLSGPKGTAVPDRRLGRVLFGTGQAQGATGPKFSMR